MRVLVITSLAALLLATPAVAKDNYPYWYLGLHGALTFVDDTPATLTGASFGTLSFDSGYSYGAALGYRPYETDSPLDYVRFEMEWNRITADLDQQNDAGIITSLDNGLKIDAVMTNVFLDIPLFDSLSPYVGAGAGIARANLESATLGIDDRDTNLAYQFMAGLTYRPENLPLTSWNLGYRYFTMDDPEFTDNLGDTLKHEVQTHSVEVGARLHF
jgi:OmpA-OmpF porin, OOP family